MAREGVVVPGGGYGLPLRRPGSTPATTAALVEDYSSRRVPHPTASPTAVPITAPITTSPG
jgi:hypothetical protein